MQGTMSASRHELRAVVLVHAGHGGYDNADSTARRGCRAVQRAGADNNHQRPLLCLLLPVLHITEGAPPTGEVACVMLRLITSGRVFGSRDLLIGPSVLQQDVMVHSMQNQQSGLEASEICHSCAADPFRAC